MNNSYPTRSEVTKTNNNNGYQDTLIDSNDTGIVGWSAVSGGIVGIILIILNLQHMKDGRTQELQRII